MRCQLENLDNISKNIRRNILRIANSSKGPHTGTALSCVDILTALYFKSLNITKDTDRDIFIMSKGHGAMAVYATLYEKGFLSSEELHSYYQNGGALPAHLDKDTCEMIEVSSGSLGHGLPMGLGFALARKKDSSNSRVAVLMGDGEIQEGSIWEAAMLAPKLGLNNLMAIIDRNNLQGYGRPSELVTMESLDDKFRAFGWETARVNGHNFKAMEEAFATKSDKPLAVICDTVKGKGVSFMEDEMKWHYFIVTDEILDQALKELEA